MTRADCACLADLIRDHAIARDHAVALVVDAVQSTIAQTEVRIVRGLGGLAIRGALIVTREAAN